jgi:hypothetical protein
VGWPVVGCYGISGRIAVVAEDRGHQAWVDALVQALQDGTPLDLAPGEDADVSQAADWPDNRRLWGDALPAALLKSDLKPDPHGLKIRAAYICEITRGSLFHKHTDVRHGGVIPLPASCAGFS